ncbi:MAG: hypothetical protein HRT94_08190 [Alphaproteobacteria bacterium]|nr:hypothetical protein [Alphaproteobacteria bacterium]
MAKKGPGPTRRVRKEEDAAWAAHKGDEGAAIDVERAWALAEYEGIAGGPVLSEAESAEIREGLTDYHFMPTAELEEMVGTADKGSKDYRMAQAVLLQRPQEYQPGSGGIRYCGANMPRFEK